MKIATRSAWLAHLRSCAECSTERQRLCPAGVEQLQDMADWMSDGESLPGWLLDRLQ